MKRPKIEDYVTDSLSSVGGLGLYNELVQYSEAQDEYIESLKKEIQHLENELGIRESFLDK